MILIIVFPAAFRNFIFFCDLAYFFFLSLIFSCYLLFSYFFHFLRFNNLCIFPKQKWLPQNEITASGNLSAAYPPAGFSCVLFHLAAATCAWRTGNRSSVFRRCLRFSFVLQILSGLDLVQFIEDIIIQDFDISPLHSTGT